MIDDLRHFGPTRPRSRGAIWALIALALALFAWHGGDVPEDRVLTMGAAQVQGLNLGSREGPARSASAPAYFGCLALRDGQWIRGAIRHCPDGTPSSRWCRHECWYGSVDRRAAM
jgi:hypothetical protein